jgi:Ca-activated chloride channel family protein
MSIDIAIDNGDARVRVREIFASHQGGVLEGEYTFGLPGGAAVSDFAVWDGVTRIPGVILERKRAEEIYENLRWQAIDPGLLQMGERTAEEARRTAVFSARIVPIPGYGTKRLEMEYHQRLPVDNLKSYFAIPLRPDAYRNLTAGTLSIALKLESKQALGDFKSTSKAYPLQIRERAPHVVRADFTGRNVALTEDFAIEYNLDGSLGPALEILTHRGANEPGFFQASSLLENRRQAGAPAASPPRTILALFDDSLSMQWEKLERSFQALESLLRSLRAGDKFNLLLFNTEVSPLLPAPAAGDAANVEKALAFVRASRLRGGTNLQLALETALKQAAHAGSETYIVLLSDGGATRGIVNNGKLADWYAAKWKQLPEAARPRTFIFATGDDANTPLLKMLARDNGVLEWVRSTEPAEFKLNAFLSKIGRQPVEGLRLATSPSANFDLIYPLEDSRFMGSAASWVGQYKKPAAKAGFAVECSAEPAGRESASGNPCPAARTSVALPAENLQHPDLPRTWAKARVDALLEKIERQGEDRATIDEIVALARKYKFVTPYTSFLAAPRALLRPRVIRPGDPVLRVRTDKSIVSVVALFPFGLLKELRYLPGEDIWQTRFLAPVDMADGAHQVRLILRDRQGQAYRESKSFLIASKPPVVRVKLERALVRRGEAVRLRVGASESTRTLTARMYGVAPVRLMWNQEAKTNLGEFIVPDFLPAGKYALTVTAEDFAHNIGSQEATLEVAP